MSISVFARNCLAGLGIAGARAVPASRVPRRLAKALLHVVPPKSRLAVFALPTRTSSTSLRSALRQALQSRSFSSTSTSAPPPPLSVESKQSANEKASSVGEDAWVRGEGGHKTVSRWLFLCCGIVFAIVILGGVTRLTRSGLSMVEWKPYGNLPPLNHEEWLKEFDKYKQFPEYQRLGREMSLDEFKFIYFMEWSHRWAARSLGIVFLLPLLYWTARGRISRPLFRRFGLLFSLGGVQACIGWWMVKSGLEDKAHSYNELPRVSPYRLAVHLISAFAIYSLLFTTALRVASLATPAVAAAAPIPRSFKVAATGLAHLIGLTAFSGAFVAGNEAGLVYNEWPKMGEGYVPDDLINPHIQPAWKNIFENSSLVQFNHRCLAYATLIGCAGLFLAARRIPLPPATRKALNSLVGMAVLQATLGITTLLHHVPVPLGAAHQTGSLVLLSIALWLMHTLRPSPATARLLQQVAQASTKAR